MFDKNVLKGMKLTELKEIAKTIGVEKINLKKDELIDTILKMQDNFQQNESSAENQSSTNTAQKKEKRKRINPSAEETGDQNLFSETVTNISEIKTEESSAETVEKHNKPNKNQKHQSKSANPQVKKELNADADKTENKDIVAEIAVVETEKPAQNQNRNKNQKKQNYRDPDYEFEGIIECEGVLEVPKDGGSHGYLRSSDYNYRKSPDDIYISQSQIRLFGLKKGDTIKGIVRPPKGNEQHFPLVRITKINGHEPDEVRDRPSFEHLTPLFPKDKFNLSGNNSKLSTRIIDLFAPIGKG